MYWKLIFNTGGYNKYILLLFFLILQFSAAWLYPPSSFNGVGTLVTEKPLGVPFQYMLWVVIFFVFCQQIYRGELFFYGYALSPFILFLIAGLISAFVGIMPFDSIKLLLLYVFMLFGGVMMAVALPGNHLQRSVYFTFAILVVFSVLLSILYPSVGAQYYGSQLVWRGLFTNKNQFGWFLSIALVVFVIFYRIVRPIFSISFILITIAALVMSGSKGSLGAAIISLAFLSVLLFFSSRISAGLFLLIVFFVVCFTIFFCYFFLTDFLIFIGRDPTLTGRTVVWGMYFNAMLNSPFFGSGPGSFTSFSEATLPIAIRLNELGAIFTPHNAYLGVFGDAGILGFISFVGILFYFSFFQYFKHPNINSLACAGLSTLFLMDGLVETHELYSPGLIIFMIVIYRAMAINSIVSDELINSNF